MSGSPFIYNFSASVAFPYNTQASFEAGQHHEIALLWHGVGMNTCQEYWHCQYTYPLILQIILAKLCKVTHNTCIYCKTRHKPCAREKEENFPTHAQFTYSGSSQFKEQCSSVTRVNMGQDPCPLPPPHQTISNTHHCLPPVHSSNGWWLVWDHPCQGVLPS